MPTRPRTSRGGNPDAAGATRAQAGLTHADLARRMHTTQSVVSRVESGVNVSIQTLARYAEACGSRLQVQMVRETEPGYGKR